MMAVRSQVGHTQRRHPLCPYCGYDLVATLAHDGRRCPECGSDFELHELHRSTAPGEWTPMRGLRNLGLALLWRCGLAAVVWAAALAGMEWIFSLLRQWVAGWGIVAWVVVLGGALCFIAGIAGARIGRHLEEIAGFAGMTLYLATVGSIIVAFIIGSTALSVTGLLGFNAAFALGVIFGAFASAAAVRQILLEDF